MSDGKPPGYWRDLCIARAEAIREGRELAADPTLAERLEETEDRLDALAQGLMSAMAAAEGREAETARPKLRVLPGGLAS